MYRSPAASMRKQQPLLVVGEWEAVKLFVKQSRAGSRASRQNVEIQMVNW